MVDKYTPGEFETASLLGISCAQNKTVYEQEMSIFEDWEIYMHLNSHCSG